MKAKAVYAVAKLTDTCIENDKQFDISIFNIPELTIHVIIYKVGSRCNLLLKIASSSFDAELDDIIKQIKS